MATNGCSGGMDTLARVVNRLRGAGQGRKLAFTGCCDEHDLFYEQGGTPKVRAFADRLLRECIAANLKKRNRPVFVHQHVPWLFWAAVRMFGWIYWAKG